MNTNNIEKKNKIKENSISINEKDKSNIQLYFESSINISEIEGKENERTSKNIITKENNMDISLNSSINLDNESIHQLKKDINNDNNIRKKLTKEDLNNIPLPIFSCIYCSNDYISFRHLLNEILSSKYYNETSIYDMKILNKIINYQPIIDQYNNNFKLLDIIIKNTDYLKKYYSKQNYLTFYKSEKYKKFVLSNNLKIKNYFIQKFENFIIRKKNKDLTNKRINSNKYINKNISYNKLSFHNNNSIGKDNLDKIFGNIKNSNTIGAGTCQGTGSYSSLNNIISYSLINNDNNNNNNNLYFNNINAMENIMEKIEKNEESENDDEGGEEFLNFFGNESQNQEQKKMNKKNISFEDKFYDIWNPDITVIDENENKDNNNNSHFNENKNKNLINKNNLNDSINININENNNSAKMKNSLSHLNNNKINININQIDKLDNNNNTQKIFTERKIKEIKRIFNSPQNSYIQKNKNNNLTINKTKNLCNMNIKKNIVNKTNNNFNYNEDKNNDNHITYDFFKNNLFNFKSFYINKNKNNNLLNLIKNKKNNILDNNILCHTRDLNKETILDKNKNKQKNNKKENEKTKNITINTNSQDTKNLLFLLKYPKLMSRSNKITPNNANINQISPKIIKKPLSSYKNLKNENYIIVKSKGNQNSRNSTSRVNKVIDKTKFSNLSQFYENNIKIYNSRNFANKRKKLLNNKNDYGDLIKSNSAIMKDNQKEKSGMSSSSNFQISKILYKNKANGKINDLMKKINNNFKININDFAFFNKNINEKNNNIKKIKFHFHSPPIISRRNESVYKPLSQKKISIN